MVRAAMQPYRSAHRRALVPRRGRSALLRGWRCCRSRRSAWSWRPGGSCGPWPSPSGAAPGWRSLPSATWRSARRCSATTRAAPPRSRCSARPSWRSAGCSPPGSLSPSGRWCWGRRSPAWQSPPAGRPRVLLVGGFLVVTRAILGPGELDGIVNPTIRLASPTVPALATAVAHAASRLRLPWRVAVGGRRRDRAGRATTGNVTQAPHPTPPTSSGVPRRSGPRRWPPPSGPFPAQRWWPPTTPGCRPGWRTGTRSCRSRSTSWRPPAGGRHAQPLVSAFRHRPGYVAVLTRPHRAAMLAELARDGIACHPAAGGLLDACR